MRNKLLALVTFVAFGSLAQAQSFSCANDPRRDVKFFCHDLTKLLEDVQANKALTTEELTNQVRGDLNQLDLSQASSVSKFISVVAPQLAEKTVAATVAAGAMSALQDAGQGRLDRQLSAPQNATGTTSLVSKAGSAELISVAMDTGILTQSTNGATTTLSTNADQLFRLITGSDADCTVTCDNKGWFEAKVLNFTSLSASLNVAQPSSTSVTTSGTASGTNSTPVGSVAVPSSVGQLSGFTARYEFLNSFDPRSAKFKQSWKQAVDDSTLSSVSQTLGDKTQVVQQLLNSKAASLDRSQLVDAAKNDQTGSQLADVFDNYFVNATTVVLQDPNIAADVAQVMQQRSLYRQAWFSALHQAAGNMLTIEYDYSHPASQPTTSVIKVIYARDFQSAGMLTFNGSVSLYNGTLPAGAKYGQLYYGQISAQYDRTLTGTDKSIQTQMSLAAYWQYQPHASVLNIPAGTVAPGTDIPLPNGTQEFVGTSGSLWVTQAKFTIKAKGGINLPIGVSWSNKTDLLQGNKIGAQVGLSYNFSSLAGLFTGGAQ